ncbi:hypothetical protein [Hymenobacter norwichensis]|uniref:hypothetical protein n=1 Tax=Hymenobacter norwichensis TaxID=223903 RepID=UPI0003B3431E|nr:hypothetical protein [Hymenobacter norwichensis]
MQYFNFSDTFVAGERRAKTQVAGNSIAVELLLRAHLRHNRYIELGYATGGLGACTVDLIDEIGRSMSWVFLTEYVPLRVGQYSPLGKGPFYLSPSLGLLYVHTKIRDSDYLETYQYARNPPEFITEQLLSFERNHFLNYEAGLTGGVRLRRWEVSMAGRYCNSFSQQYVGQVSINYTQDQMAQPQMVSKNRLQAWSLTAGVSYQLRK